MVRRKILYITLIIFGVFINIFFVACNSKETMEPIESIENFKTEGLTLLERTYEDTDNDGDNETIELYTDAQIAPDGMMGWDTGHQWALIIRKGESVFSLFDNWVQHGDLQFWIVSYNEDQIQEPESMDLKREIYVIITTDYGFELFKYYWDKESLSYKKEDVLNPKNQWFIRHSKKYTMPDPTKIEQKQ